LTVEALDCKQKRIGLQSTGVTKEIMPGKNKIIFIMGYGHSGSTLLDIILGNQKNITSLGEMFQFAPFSWKKHRFCACGLPHMRCPFWEEVTDRYRHMAAWSNATILEELKGKYDVWRSIRCWKRLTSESSEPSFDYLRYQNYLESMYKAVFQTSGSRLAVDSSKSPCRAVTLAGMDSSIDFRFIHLVRDGRAVGWSMLKKKARQTNVPLSKRQQLLVCVKAAIGWIFVNILSEIAGKIIGSDRYVRIRYEDMITNQKYFFSKIEMLVKQPMDDPYDAIRTGAELHVGHLVAGNRMMNQNKVVFRPDINWRTHLPPIFKILYSLLCGWALKRYGYPVK